MLQWSSYSSLVFRSSTFRTYCGTTSKFRVPHLHAGTSTWFHKIRHIMSTNGLVNAHICIREWARMGHGWATKYNIMDSNHVPPLKTAGSAASKYMHTWQTNGVSTNVDWVYNYCNTRHKVPAAPQSPSPWHNTGSWNECNVTFLALWGLKLATAKIIMLWLHAFWIWLQIVKHGIVCQMKQSVQVLTTWKVHDTPTSEMIFGMIQKMQHFQADAV
jgi:hypothetical protein